jgi:glycosyltransferase involved in cell wall biosynthesis
MEKLDMQRIRVAMVTNIPAPYRMPVYEILGCYSQIDLKVFFCAGREPDRFWDLPKLAFKQKYLRGRFITYRSRFIHINPDVWEELRSFRPDVVITTGFNPTHLLAYAYALINGAKHVAMTDGTIDSEIILSPIHRWLRRIVYAGTQTFIGASDGSFNLYRMYGIDEAYLYKSHLCANNAKFFNTAPLEKRYDLVFSGRFVALKNPLFALEVARRIAIRLGRRISLNFLGSGELEGELRALAAAMTAELDVAFSGYAKQDELPKIYGSGKIFMLPTVLETWGVVANEACAAGLPVLISAGAGAAGEIIRDGENGFILPLDIEMWVDRACRLLSDSALYSSMSSRSRVLVEDYNYDNAAKGILDAVEAAFASGVKVS